MRMLSRALRHIPGVGRAGRGRDLPEPEVAELVVDGGTYPLRGRGPWSIGRSRKNDIVLPSSYVSLQHARLSRAGDGFVIEDLGSTNGTLVDGAPTERGRIEGGEELTFGGVCAARLRVNRTDEGDPYSRKSGDGQLPYLPGLDGLRALAVIAVLLYHAGLGWIPGGFLGVEIFFVLSGYLITSLLLGEWRRQGRIDFGAFWLRRARRLLPALYLLLVVTLAFAVLFLPGQVVRLRGDSLAAFFYVTNWYLVFNHVSYFEAVGRPSLLKHLWSLAIEEQFYVVWPLLLTAGMVLLRARRMLFAVLVGAVASTVLMAVLYTPNVDPSRVYYGTDTRAASLLIGAALAFLWVPGQSPRRARPILPLLLDAMGLAALGALVFFCLRIGEYQPFLYRGGFALVSLVTAALILPLVHPRAHLGANLLGRQPLRWIGLRSYGIYLWHWPIFMVTRPGLDVPIDGLPLLALRLAATAGIAALSYRYVETPIRRGALGRAWRSLREARGSRRWRLGLRWAGVLVPGLALCAVLGVAVVQARPPQPPSYLAKMKVHVENPVRKSGPGRRISKTSPGAKAPATTPQSAAGRAKATTTRSSGVTSAGTVTAVGDSVMIGAVPELERDIPNLTLIDARGSREAPAAINVLRKWRAEGKLGDVVIVHIGSNGEFTSEEFDEMMRVLAGVRKVLVVNTTVPDGYQWAPNNAVLANGVKRYPKKAVLVDWHAASAGHPEYFWDGLHLTPQGAQAYARLIAAAYKKQVRSP